jgi:inner membrane protein
MDPLAHTLVGATLAETGLKRLTPLGTTTLIVAANAPDVDAVTYLIDGDLSLYLRRGCSHGLLAEALWPLAIAVVMLVLDRLLRWWAPHRPRVRAGPTLALAAIGGVTHPLLDWMNSYGIRLLMPFDGRWFYGDTLFIIDPWVWLITACAVAVAGTHSRAGTLLWTMILLATSALILVAPMAAWPVKVLWVLGVATIAGIRLLAGEERRVDSLARGCLMSLAAYIVAMLVMGRIASHQAEASLRAAGVRPASVAAMPMPANPFRRDVIAVTPERYYFLLVDWLATPRITESSPSLARVPVSAPIEAALAAPQVRGLRTWLRFPSYEVHESAGGYRVTIRDVRFWRQDGVERGGLGIATVELDRQLVPLLHARDPEGPILTR